MNSLIRLVLGQAFVLACLFPQSAFSQSALGELLDAGASQLPQSELVALLTGKTAVFSGLDGSAQQIAYKADGSYSGTWALGGTTAPFFGSWAVQEDGQICLTAGSGKSRGQKLCGYWFKVTDQYFASPSTSDRGAPIYKRSVK